MKKARRTCIFVAGMHRSETSVFTQVLGLLGCDTLASHIDKNQANEYGHWESRQIERFNDQLLEAAGSHCDDLGPLTPGWLKSAGAEELKRQCRDLFDAEFGQSRLAVLNEPRICRLLPFWLEVMERESFEPLIILPIRNPLSVGNSLAESKISDPFYNQMLWLRHVLDAEKGSRGAKRFFCSYDDLIKSWSTVISNSETVLGFEWPKFSLKAQEEVDRYISSRQLHQPSLGPKILDDLCPSVWLRETYRIMLNWVATGESETDFAALDAIHAAFDEACINLSSLLYGGRQAQADLHTLRNTLAQRDQSLSEFAQQAETLDSELKNLRQNLAEVSFDHMGQVNRVEELEAALKNALDAKKLCDSRIMTLEARIVQRHDSENLARALISAESVPETELAVAKDGTRIDNQDSAQSQPLDQELNVRCSGENTTLDQGILVGLKAHIDLLMVDLENAQIAQTRSEAALARLEAQTEAEINALVKVSERTMKEAQNELEAHQKVLEGAGDHGTSVNIISGLLAHIDLLLSDVEAAQSAQSNAAARLIHAEATVLKTQVDMQQLRADHESQVAPLMVQLQAAQQEKTKQDQLISILNERIDFMLSDLEAANVKASTFARELERAKDQRDADMAHFAAAQGDTISQLETLKTELASHTQTRDGLHKAVRELEAQVAAAYAALEASRTAADAASQQANEDLALSYSQRQDLQAELNRFKAITDGLKRHVQLLTIDLDSKTAELEVERKNLAGLWRIVDELQADQAAIERREQAAIQNVEALSHKISQTESALLQRNAETIDLHRDLEAAQARLEAESHAKAIVEAEKAKLTTTLNARISIMTQDLENRELELEKASTALERMQSTLLRQARDHQAAMVDKELNAKAQLEASIQTAQKLRNQVDLLVKSLAEERPAFFERKSVSVARRAALLNSAGVIDAEWYLAVNNDVAVAGIDPAIHYLTAGIIEGRSRCPS